MIFVFLATLGIAVVAFVLYPVFVEEQTRVSTGPLDESERRLADLAEKKARLYDAIKDLDFEKEAGKLSEEDYQRARNEYLAQVAEVLEGIDALAPAKTETRKGKKKVRGKRAATAEPTEKKRPCTSCGESNRAGARFCSQCGKPLELTCKSCGEPLAERARFCSSCGERVAS